MLEALMIIGSAALLFIMIAILMVLFNFIDERKEEAAHKRYLEKKVKKERIKTCQKSNLTQVFQN